MACKAVRRSPIGVALINKSGYGWYCDKIFLVRCSAFAERFFLLFCPGRIRYTEKNALKATPHRDVVPGRKAVFVRYCLKIKGYVNNVCG